MSVKFYLEKLFSSEEFKKFMKENPDAYLCSGFFIIDKEKDENKIHFDYFSFEKNKIFSFQLDEGIKIVPIEKLDEKNPKKISNEFEFEFEDIENLIVREMEKHNVESKIQKIILSLQEINGKNHLLGTVFISMLGLLKIDIDLSNEKIVEFEKKSFFDIMKVRKG